MPHEEGHTQTTQIPAVQLPVGAVPNPQAGTSKDVLDLFLGLLLDELPIEVLFFTGVKYVLSCFIAIISLLLVLLLMIQKDVLQMPCRCMNHHFRSMHHHYVVF